MWFGAIYIQLTWNLAVIWKKVSTWVPFTSCYHQLFHPQWHKFGECPWRSMVSGCHAAVKLSQNVCNLRLKGCIWHTFKVYQTREPGFHPSWHLCISHFSFFLVHLVTLTSTYLLYLSTTLTTSLGLGKEQSLSYNTPYHISNLACLQRITRSHLCHNQVFHMPKDASCIN